MRLFQSASQAAPGKPRVRLGLIGVVVALALLAFLLWRGIPLLSSLLTGKQMKGEFLAAEAVPSPEGGHRLWILTDGSFIYIKSVSRPGYKSVGRECRSCKTWLYVYDPVQKKVLTKFRTDYKGLILYPWMAAADGKIWVATGPYKKNEPRIFGYSVEPAALIEETAAFTAKFPELSSGLIGLRMIKDPARIILDTKDGRTGLILSLADEKLYPNNAEFERSSGRNEDETVTVFALGEVDNGPRKKLYKVTGPRERVESSSVEFMLRDPASLKSTAEISAESVASDRIFIEGLIFYQDADCCLVLHQDAAGQSAGRLLTCIDAAGAEKWTAAPADLFKEFKVDIQKDSTSAIFFRQDDIDVSRSGNLILLQLKGVGAIGFDFESGKKLWEVRL